MRPWDPWFPGDYSPGPHTGPVLPEWPDGGVALFAPCECVIHGDDTVQCGEAWIGQIVPSQCAALNQFAAGTEGVESDELEISGNPAGALVVTPTTKSGTGTMLICNTGGVGKSFFICCVEIQVDCAVCCEAFGLSGGDTAIQGSTWKGIIDPPCPGAVCVITPGGGDTEGKYACTINEAGSQASVVVDGAACAGFTVTVTEPEGCEDDSASMSVRITDGGGGWDDETFVEACEAEEGDCPGAVCEGFIAKYCEEGIKCYDYGFYCSGVAGQCVGSPCRPPCYSEEDCSQTVCWSAYDTIDWSCTGDFGGWC